MKFSGLFLYYYWEYIPFLSLTNLNKEKQTFKLIKKLVGLHVLIQKRQELYKWHILSLR